MKSNKVFLYLIMGSLAAILLATSAPEVQAANPLHKIGRGLGNIIIAPAEIPVSIVSEGNKNPFLGLLMGPVVGTVNCVTRVAGGLVELITFPVPPYDQPIYDKNLGETIWGSE